MGLFVSADGQKIAKKIIGNINKTCCRLKEACTEYNQIICDGIEDLPGKINFKEACDTQSGIYRFINEPFQVSYFLLQSSSVKISSKTNTSGVTNLWQKSLALNFSAEIHSWLKIFHPKTLVFWVIYGTQPFLVIRKLNCPFFPGFSVS